MVQKEYAKVDFLRSSLLLENNEDAAYFAEACGYELFTEDESEVSL